MLAQQGVDYEEMSETESVEFFTDTLLSDRQIIDPGVTDGLGETATRVARRFDELGDWQREYGVDAIDTYCIRMCEELSLYIN